MASRSGIHIKPGHEGLFTRQAQSQHLSPQQFASKVEADPGDYSAKTRKRAVFAENAKHWHHG